MRRDKLELWALALAAGLGMTLIACAVSPGRLGSADQPACLDDCVHQTRLPVGTTGVEEGESLWLLQGE